MPDLRVAVDLTALAQQVGRPLAGCLAVRFAEALMQHAPGVTFVVLTRPEAGAALAHLEAGNARQLIIAEPRPLRYVLARLQRRLRRSRFGNRLEWLRHLRPRLSRRPGVLARLGVDVVFCPFTSPGFAEPAVPLVIAISDLQHVSHPHLLGSRERAARAQASMSSYRRASAIVCSALSLRGVALQCDGVLAERVLTIPPGRLLAQPPASRPVTVPTLARHGLEDNRYFLFVADFEPRHNHRLVLTALAIFRARYPDSDIRLVCVGGPHAGRASFKAVAEQMGLGRHVQFPGVLGHEETLALMQGCRAVLVPALYETVGETVLEAMQLGRPVLCSQVPGLAELTGSAALTFDPHRPADLAAAFERVECDPALLDRGGRLGRERVAMFDDAAGVAEAYLDVFRKP